MTKGEQEKINKLLGFIYLEAVQDDNKTQKCESERNYSIMCAIQGYYGKLGEQLEVTHNALGHLPKLDPKILEL